MIGRKLADTLETGLGKRIVIMSQNPDNEIADRGFRVVGLFDANMDAIEEGFVFIGKQTAQTLLDVPDRVTEVFALGDDYRDVDALLGQMSVLQDSDIRESIADWLDELSEKQREVLSRRFGLRGYESSTLEEVGREIGLTRERVRQIQVEALRRLRSIMESNGLSSDSLFS